MKRTLKAFIVMAGLALALAVPALVGAAVIQLGQTGLGKPRSAQAVCHDEYICTPFGGCRWVTICR